jgi:hypothetical protein
LPLRIKSTERKEGRKGKGKEEGEQIINDRKIIKENRVWKKTDLAKQ